MISKSGTFVKTAAPGVWDTVRSAISELSEKAKTGYGNLTPAARSLLNTGLGASIGSLAGLGIGATKKRPGKGAAIGAIAGAALGDLASVNWNGIRKAIEDAAASRAAKKSLRREGRHVAGLINEDLLNGGISNFTGPDSALYKDVLERYSNPEQ